MRIRGQGGGIEVQHKSTAPRRGGAGEHDIPSWQQGSNIRMWTRDGNRPEKTSHLANFINVRLILLKIQRLKIAVKLGFPGSSVVQNPPASAGDMGSIPGLGRSHVPWSIVAHVPLLSLCSRTQKSQLLKPHALELVLSNKRSHPHKSTHPS